MALLGILSTVPIVFHHERVEDIFDTWITLKE
jgi:hypothetical protein